jgi:nucleotide-binding universal stress UspA family protein
MGSQFIVGFDGTAGGRDALALATALADAAPGRDVALTVASISPLDPYRRAADDLRTGYEAALAEQAGTHLQDARDLCADRGDVSFVVRPGRSPARGLHLLADELQADLVVVGRSHTGPLGRAFLGSATEQTLHGAGCPVAVAPVGYADAPHRIRTVAVAYTGSGESGTALTWATRVARDRGASLLLVRVIEPVPFAYGAVVDPYPMAARQDDVQHALEAAADLIVDLEVRTTVLQGDAVHALSGLQGRADLLVLGSRDLGPVGRLLLGGVGSRLARHCPTPLLVVPRFVDPANALAHPSVAGAAVAP